MRAEDVPVERPHDSDLTLAAHLSEWLIESGAGRQWVRTAKNLGRRPARSMVRDHLGDAVTVVLRARFR